jgi:hypothetical protein
VTVFDPAAAAARYQGDLMEGGTGWVRVCHADGAITLVPIGLVPLAFETEGSVILDSVGPAHESQDKLDSELLRRNRQGKGKLKSAC